MKNIVVDHLGREYDSVTGMCKEWHVNRYTYSDRIERGWSVEEALTGNKKKKIPKSKECKDHLGNDYSSIAEMCREYNVEYTIYRRRRDLGWTLKEALTGKDNPIKPNSKTCYDHYGNCFNSAADMCRLYGIPIDKYRSRKKLGWTTEEILTNHKNNPRVKEHIDYLGNVYKSETAMCRAHSIKRNVYRTRISLGWTNKEALTGQKDENHTNRVRAAKPCFDHKGNSFNSLKEMCEAYGINRSTYKTRIKSGYPLEVALTGYMTNKDGSKGSIPIDEDNKLKKPCFDHLGNKYENVNQMCQAYGINVGTFYGRSRRFGWTLEDALTKPVHNYVCDHLNNEFISAKEMCNHYGVRFDVFYRRRKLGWTLEEALTDSKEHELPRALPCKDHKGNQFSSRAEMCRYWNIDFNVYKDRAGRLGWTLEEALTIPKSYSLGEYRVSLVLNNCCEKGVLDSFYHNITIKKTFELLGRTSQYKDFLSSYEDALLDAGISISKQRLAKFRFDFTLIQNDNIFAFIEFDGAQHFTYIDVFFKTLSNFLYRHNSDIAKNIFAEANEIPLLRIRYDQDDMSTIEYMINDLLQSPTKYINKHNTFLTEDEYMSAFTRQEGFIYSCVST